MVKKEEYSIYNESHDITFIMVDEWLDDEIISTECTGWYYGRPNNEDNKDFIGKLKATYEWGL